MSITIKEFVEKTLIGEIRDIQQTNNHHYLSFGLISQGIEFLGCLLDGKGFFKVNKSKERFRNAIDKLFPETYRPYNFENGQYDLYDGLRCGLLHVYLPKSHIELIQKSEISNFGNHLEIKRIRNKEMLILVSEELFSDFEKACKEVLRRIDKDGSGDNILISTE